VELSVIGVLMASDAMGRDDVSDCAAIHGEQQRTKYGSLGYSDFQGGFRRPMLPAALASQTVSGPVDMTESRIVQSQTLRTLSRYTISDNRKTT